MKLSEEDQHKMDIRFTLPLVVGGFLFYATHLSFYQAIIISLILILSSLPIAAILKLQPKRSKYRDILLTLVCFGIGLLNFLFLPKNYASEVFDIYLFSSIFYLIKKILYYLISKAE